LYTVHGAMYFRDNSRLGNLAGWVFEKWCCTWARRVLLQSEEDAHALAAARISRPRKLTYIGNGVALDRFEAPVKDPVADAKPPIVLMISRLVAEKGCRDFIEVARALRGRARFVHVGPVEHDQRDALTSEEIARAEADVGVEFRGYASDVRPHVAEADIVLQPSYREGIPRAVMESAAGGRPVVGYDVRGVREVVPPELDLLASRGDVAAVTGIVRDLIDDPELRVKKAAACQAWVLERFSEERVVERLRQVYREMADAA
jgi:glycosyltransferase involved in cell wall biosynthesis